MPQPTATTAEPPERLHWIVGARHIEALTNAAEWLHANSHFTEQPRRRPDRNKPCDACWRAAAYATKGVLLAGYQRRDQVLHEAAELLLTDADLRTAEGEITTPREWRDAAQFLLAARSAQTPQET